jgi:hypothetical protein
MKELGARYTLRRVVVAVAIAASIHLIDGAQTLALADDNRGGLRAIPSVFVGSAPGCAPSPAGSNIVTSAWLRGMGLPDNGTSNVTPMDPPNRDPHRGLILSKNGSTSDCSAAQARILGVAGMKVEVGFTLGFDYRHGSHCTGGSPRFNVSWRLGNTDGFSFVGRCDPQAAPQDPQWGRDTFVNPDPTAYFPPIPLGARIRSIELIFDEGTDASSPDDPMGVGLAVVDNININGRFITRGTGIAPDGDDDDGRREDEDGEWHSKELRGGESADFPMAADANSLAVGGAVDDGQLVIMEIYNPAGVLVGTSLPAAGRVILSVPTAISGQYIVRLRNLGLTSVTTTVTLVTTVMR